MNIRMHSGRRRAGITLLEVMILLAVMAVAAVLILPWLMRPRIVRPPQISCVNNLKQVALSFRFWASDHGDRFPASVAMTNDGAMDNPLAYEPWMHYQVLSNELNTPKILVCPADNQRSRATNFAVGFGNSNLSYFVSLDADETLPQMILSGDRNLSSNGVAMAAGLRTLTTNATHGWTKAMHNQCGNIGLSDGSVQQFTSAALQQYLRDHPQTNRLAIP
jgi:competence protein ComGC